MAILKYKTDDGYVSIPMTVPTKSNEENGNGIGTCDTSSGTSLEVTLLGYNLVQNGFIAVTFEHDVPANATININGNGAKPIIYKGSAITANTIKADDTITFCYNGSQYVVTSLGGGSNSGFVGIKLTEPDDEVDGLIGTTITITNEDTSETILSTTWQGDIIVAEIADGIEYTVTAGNATGYNIYNNSETHTAIGGFSLNIIFEYESIYKSVDLGLPSGTKWMKGNIISDGKGGYKIGEETDYGCFVSFGNVTPHFSSNGTSFDDGYSFDNNTYASTPGAAISTPLTTDATFAPNSGYDVARELLGGSFRLPTLDEYKELIDNCTSVWTTKNGVYGREVTSNINGKKIFFPASGIGVNVVSDRGGTGFY